MKSSCILLAVCLLLPLSAQAAEDEVLLAFEGGYQILQSPEDTQHGGAGHFTVSYGLTDELWLTGSLGGGGQVAGEIRPRVTLFEGFGGIMLALDVLRTIPFLELMIGGVLADLGERTELAPTFRLGVGADYLISPAFSIGGVVRYRPVNDDIGEAVVTVQARLCWRIEL